METNAKFAVENLNLFQIKRKLMSKKGWSLKKANEAVKWYKRFLYLCTKYDGIVPNEMIDEVWHLHILDTRKYAEDCQVICGQFIHHQPSYGGEDERDLQSGFDQTNLYYEIEFGEAPKAMGNENLQLVEKATCDIKKATCGFKCRNGK